MTTANQTRRSVMNMAWSFRRTDPARPFANCLRGAWRYIKRLAAEAARFMRMANRAGGKIRLSRSLIQSPIGRRTGHGSRADWNAAYLTARVGY